MSTIASTKTQAIKAGDLVRIITPEWFVRCGYEYAFADALREVEATMLTDIQALINKTSPWSHPKLQQKILTAFAYDHLRKNCGSKNQERKIFTRVVEKDAHDASVMENPYMVSRVKFVKTGKRDAGYPYTGWDDEGEPPSFHNERTHRILEIGWGELTLPGSDGAWSDNNWIEARCVQKEDCSTTGYR
jgi:hypothetical protein